MKRFTVSIAMAFITFYSFAQDESEEVSHKFRRDNIFVGGSIGLGLGSGYFSGGANPEIGYTISKWFDAGFSANINYYTLSAEYNNGYRQRSFNYGGGMFTRFYPFKGFFLQVLPEYNRINTNEKYYNGTEEFKIKQEAPSLLLGVGYGSREVGQSNFFTVIMFDAGNNTNSPYISYLGSKQPILRAGFNVYLRPKRR